MALFALSEEFLLNELKFLFHVMIDFIMNPVFTLKHINSFILIVTGTNCPP